MQVGFAEMVWKIVRSFSERKKGKEGGSKNRTYYKGWCFIT